MRPTRLIIPTPRFEASHRSLVREFTDQGEELVPWVLGEVGDDFEAYINELDRQSRGLDLRDDQVPHSTFWLVDDSDEIVAVSNLRHRLNEFLSELGGHIGFGVRPSARRQGFATEILRGTLAEARRFGIESAFVTCDKGNVGSERAIRRNGGVLQDEIWADVYSCVVQRYWISTADDR